MSHCFEVGDIVEIAAEAAATGMLDFKDGKGYEVKEVGVATIQVTDESGRSYWYHSTHFKLKEKKGSKMEQECKFKVGQTVWDVRVGKGEVIEVHVSDDFGTDDFGTSVEVLFENGECDLYTSDGKLLKTDSFTSLYFSEPKIEAATEPSPIPQFEPKFIGGEKIAAVCKSSGSFYKIVVAFEEKDVVQSNHLVVFEKCKFDFYRLGEKVEF